MSDKRDVFEDDNLVLFSNLKSGTYEKLKNKKVKWIFKQTGGQAKIPEQNTDVAIDKKTISAKITFPKVKDDEPNYEVRYEVDVDTDKKTGKQEYIVWPKSLELKALHKVNGVEQLCKGFAFQVKSSTGVADADKALSTDSAGLHKYGCTVRGAHEITPLSPWQIDSWKKKTGRKREAIVSRKKYQAELVWPPHKGSPHKQYVNLAAAADTYKGSRTTVKVGAKGDKDRAPKDRLGLEKDEIHIQVVFSDKNSKRNDPKPRLIVGGADVAAEADKRTFKSILKLGPGGEPAKCEIELGKAGGDECEIKVGVTDACGDDSVKLVNWRKFKFEVFQPQPDVVSSYTVFKGDKTIGLSKDYESALNDSLKKVFVEFDFAYAGSAFFGKADVGAHADWQIHDGKHFKKTAGKKVYTSTVAQLDGVRLAKGPSEASQSPDTLITAWADYLLSNSGMQPVTTEMSSSEKTVTDQHYRFLYDPTNTVKTLAISALHWRATHFRKLLNWKPIAAPTDPGWDKKDWQAVTPLTEAELQNWIELVDFHKIKFKLPARAANPNDPGTWAATLDTTVKISMYLQMDGFWMEANAAGWHGYILMSTEAGDAKKGGLISTILHEMGHNMAQSYASKAGIDASAMTPSAYGLSAAKQIPNIAFPAVAPAGFIYEKLGHTGPHCAFGIPDADRQTAVTNNNIFPYAKKAKCVMYGSGDMKSTDLKVFCEKCEPFIKSIDASNIKTHWNE